MSTKALEIKQKGNRSFVSEVIRDVSFAGGPELCIASLRFAEFALER